MQSPLLAEGLPFLIIARRQISISHLSSCPAAHHNPNPCRMHNQCDNNWINGAVTATTTKRYRTNQSMQLVSSLANQRQTTGSSCASTAEMTREVLRHEDN